MTSSGNIGEIASGLLETVGLSLLSCVSIQSLWAGYGHICRVEAIPQASENGETCRADARPKSLILKYVSPPTNNRNKKIAAFDEGHVRKILSYQVEQYFYSNLAIQMPADIALASCLASIDSSAGIGNTTAMILIDLRESYPVPGEKRASLSRTQTNTALKWLADFHGFWWKRAADIDRSSCVLPPKEHYKVYQSTTLPGKGGIWLNGGYTYLSTRQSEYESLLADSDSEWSSLLGDTLPPGQLSIAERVSGFLSPSRQGDQKYITLLHGDVKSENLFTSTDGNSVVLYDFQYVGLGYAVCDLAKFFTCSVPLQMLAPASTVHSAEELSMQPGEEKLLRAYLSSLQQRSGRIYPWESFVRHWETALVDWLRFQASWGFWGNTEWLETRVRSIIRDETWRSWLIQETSTSPSPL